MAVGQFADFVVVDWNWDEGFLCFEGRIELLLFSF